MSSLAEVSNLLVEQNTLLATQADAVMNTDKQIKKLTGYFTGLDAEERQREGTASPVIDAPSAPGITEGSSTGGSLFSGLALTPGLLLGLAKSFGIRLLKGGLIVALADNIGKAIAEFLGAEEFQGEITRALTFAGIGSIFGAKFALLGAAFGAILDQYTLDKITPIISDISDKIKQLAEDYLPSIETLQTGLITGLEGLRNLLTGNFADIWQEGQVTETLLLLGGLATVILGPRNALGAAISAASFAWAPVRGIFNKIAGLGNTIAASGGAMTGMTRAQQMAAIPDTDLARQGYTRQRDGLIVDKKTKTPISNQQLSQLNRTGPLAKLTRLVPMMTAFLTGPVGAAILGVGAISALGYFAIDAFMETETYKNLKKKSDDIGKAIDSGMTGQGSMSLEETSMYDTSPLNRVAADSQMQIDYNASVRANRAAKEIERFGRRERQVNAVVNAPQTNSSSSSSVVQNNSIMNSGTIDPSDQINPHTH